MKIDETISFGVQIPRSEFLDPRQGSIQELIRWSQLLEKSGFDSVWLEDHVVGGGAGEATAKWLECFTCLTLMGWNTKSLHVGSLVTDPLRRTPPTLAQTLATMNDVLKGRAVLGIGAGESMQFHPLGMPTDHLFSRLEEALEVINLIWTSRSPDGTISYQGNYYVLNKFLNSAIRPNKKPQVYLASFGRRMLELTGRLGDGWIPFSHSPEWYSEGLDVILQSARKAGRVGTFSPGQLILSSFSKDRYHAYKQIERLAKWHIAWIPDFSRRVGLELPKELELANMRWNKDNVNRIDEFAKQIPEKVALDSVIAGNAEDWIEQIDRFLKAGMRHFVFRLENPMIPPKSDQVFKTIGAKVLPYFRRTKKE